MSASEIDFTDIPVETIPALESGTEASQDEEGAADWMSLDDPDTEEVPGEAPNTDFMGKKARKAGALKYQKKASNLLTFATILSVQRPNYVADGAAIVMTGKKLAVATGDLAAEDERVAGFLDMLDEGIQNPYLAFMIAAAPLAMQLVRNHEPMLEPKPRKIGFWKFKVKIPIHLGLKLGILRNATAAPDQLLEHVFTDPKVVKKFQEMEVPVAFTPRNARRR